MTGLEHRKYGLYIILLGSCKNNGGLCYIIEYDNSKRVEIQKFLSTFSNNYKMKIVLWQDWRKCAMLTVAYKVEI